MRKEKRITPLSVIAIVFATITIFLLVQCKVRKPVSTNAGKFPSDKVENEFARLRNITVNNQATIVVSRESISPIVDSNLKQLLPATHFYFSIIQSPSDYEYDLGSIQTISAISTVDDNDVRLLLPFDYCKSSSNFFNLFYGKVVNGNKEEVCKSISDLFIKTYPRHAFNCDKEMKGLNENVSFSNNICTVNTSWKDNCWDFNKTKKDAKEHVANKATIFMFKADTLIAIDYSDWKK